MKLLFICLLSILFFSCKKEGCTNITAVNYNSEANEDDNTCDFIFYNADYVIKDSIFANTVFTRQTIYTLKTELNESEDTLFIYNVWGINEMLYAIPASNHSFSIPSQIYDQQTKISGFGQLNDRSIYFETSHSVIKHIYSGQKL